ncbi:MAG: (2Fe-2S) ferredoxin domain-containing protein [Spirochaetes bacterium]|nr:(2Fe-2S) ferredoxin domain-containing protein [Spirochaetota bacterium]
MGKFNSVKEFLSYSSKKEKDTIQLLVGRGSCGIAAGADRVYDTFIKEIKNRGLKNVVLKQVGCLGLCFSEPNVEVIVPGLPNILYGKVDENFAIRIIEKHIYDRKIINQNIYDKPYINLLDL